MQKSGLEQYGYTPTSDVNNRIQRWAKYNPYPGPKGGQQVDALVWDLSSQTEYDVIGMTAIELASQSDYFFGELSRRVTDDENFNTWVDLVVGVTTLTQEQGDAAKRDPLGAFSSRPPGWQDA